jgi:hypothetical protein
MIPSTVDPFWYETYWYGVPQTRRQHWHGVARRDLRRHPRIDPAKLAVGLLFAALLIGTVLLALFGPAVPADAPYFVT